MVVGKGYTNKEMIIIITSTYSTVPFSEGINLT